MPLSVAIEVRVSAGEDAAAIESLYPQAFPDEDLVPLVKELLPDSENVLSLVATTDSKIAGHGAFTRCGVAGSDIEAVLLAPLAVAPERQRRGVGTSIIRDGLQRLREDGAAVVLVLGDPGYYGRHGFRPESSITPPYPLPAEWTGAWQSLWLDATANGVSGVLSVPSVWRDPVLWAP